MNPQQRPIIIICGLVAVSTMAYTAMQLAPLFFGPVSPAPNTARPEPLTKAISEKEPIAIPTVSIDPFRKIGTTAIVPTAALPSGAPMTMGQTGTTSMGSQPSMSPTGQSIQGGVGTVDTTLPAVSGAAGSPNGEMSQPNTATVAASRPTIAFRGVIEADKPRAFLAVRGRPARPFMAGAEIAPGIHLLAVSASAVEINLYGEPVRLRIGQEVEL